MKDLEIPDLQEYAEVEMAEIDDLDPEYFKRKDDEMNQQEMAAELERLKTENASLKARAERKVSLKVSEKGAVSLYGLGRFPVTLYKEQWAKVLEMADEIRAFIETNDARLKAKE